MKKIEECNRVMDIYLGLDKGERVPLNVTLHLLTCAKCRKQVKGLKKAEKLARAPLEIPVPIDDSTILAVMHKINPQYSELKNPISITKWIIYGLAMIVFMLAFGLSKFQESNKGVVISFYIVFALAVSAYCAIFVGTNMDYFVKMMTTKKTAA
ncbi:MAG: hypothetical protein K6E69_10295 [Treponema sp.]|uniref:hypothetical protein n=1 Tax=Treponema sp. TaxID=166 RepID=UPI00298D6414|nr:hypothetical protein [Treponema sp.]MCR5387497.1 hypothetical protein [Treponema sp.]